MRKRREKAIWFHRFNKMNNPHEWHFAELLLYLPLQNEDDPFHDNFEKCLGLFDLLCSIKKQVMLHLDYVFEARERAEEFLSEIGDVWIARKKKRTSRQLVFDTLALHLDFKDANNIHVL